jgi:hypothetical protein
MKIARQMAAAFTLFLLACQPARLPAVTIIDNDQILTLQTDQRVPSAFLNPAGIKLRPNERLLLNGISTLDQPITTYPITLQLRRAVPITLIAAPTKDTPHGVWNEGRSQDHNCKRCDP